MADFPDWKKKSNYLTDPLEPYIGMIRSWKMSAADENFYRHMQWRWEFLRRHPQYIKGWRKASASHDLSNSMFGLVIKAPDPFEPRSFPVFFGKFPDDTSYSLLELPVTLRLDESLDLQIKQIKSRFMAARRHITKVSRMSGTDFKLGRTHLREVDLVRALRVLDALRAGACPADIGRELGSDEGKYRPSEYGNNYIKQALDIQEKITHLPRQKLPS
jgi:hypothetical protein